jgi:glycerol-3-phosphate acyltransferase PlsX
MKIAVDAMGGDHAPDAIIKGAIEAAKLFNGNVDIALVGNGPLLREKLSHITYRYRPQSVTIVEAAEVIEMGESPVSALRKKRNSSLVVAMDLLKTGQAQAVVSAGNTGAVMASALLHVGRLEGVNRPAIASVLPNQKGITLAVDVGANTDCKPLNLLQFGIMGSLYYRHIFRCPNPRVGLLNIGEERTKGNDLTLEAYSLLSKSQLNFIGNVEGKDILSGAADVIVCDGFLGNVILKFAESIVGLVSSTIRDKVASNVRSKLGAFLLAPAFIKFKRKLDYEEYGGAPLLGIDGVCVICHGGSSSKAIKNAVTLAVRIVNSGVNNQIKYQLHEMNTMVPVIETHEVTV